MTQLNQLPAIALASKSPRRQQLLDQLQVKFKLVAVDVDESVRPQEAAVDYVRRLAIEKAQAGSDQLAGEIPTLGADTIVVVDQQVLGKPRDQQDAAAMLELLENRSHQVMTAIALVTETEVLSDVITTEVNFRAISDVEKAEYWHTGEPCDKAGGYGIQGIGGKFVTRINGSYHAVVGLPLMETEQLLKRINCISD